MLQPLDDLVARRGHFGVRQRAVGRLVGRVDTPGSSCRRQSARCGTHRTASPRSAICRRSGASALPRFSAGIASSKMNARSSITGGKVGTFSVWYNAGISVEQQIQIKISRQHRGLEIDSPSRIAPRTLGCSSPITPICLPLHSHPRAFARVEGRVRCRFQLHIRPRAALPAGSHHALEVKKVHRRGIRRLPAAGGAFARQHQSPGVSSHPAALASSPAKKIGPISKNAKCSRTRLNCARQYPARLPARCGAKSPSHTPADSAISHTARHPARHPGRGGGSRVPASSSGS